MPFARDVLTLLASWSCSATLTTTLSTVTMIVDKTLAPLWHVYGLLSCVYTVVALTTEHNVQYRFIPRAA